MDYISNGNVKVTIEEAQTDTDKDAVVAYEKCIASAKDIKQKAVSKGKQSIRDRLK